MNDQPRMVKICELWERVSAKGTHYFSGFAGPVNYLLFDGSMKPHPTRPDEQVHIWRLMVQEADPDRRPARRVTELAESFDCRPPDEVPF
jgi:hypothetical protein